MLLSFVFVCFGVCVCIHIALHFYAYNVFVNSEMKVLGDKNDFAQEFKGRKQNKTQGFYVWL